MLPGLELVGVDLAEHGLRPRRLACVGERDDDAIARLQEPAEVVLGLGEAARGDGRALRLERERLPARERVDRARAVEPNLVAQLLPPDRARLVDLPDQVAPPDGRHEVVRHVDGAGVRQLEVQRVQPSLGCRVDDGVRERVERPLGEGRERPDRLDLVAEQLDPDRLATGRAEDVHDPAANGELASLVDTLDALVAGEGELLGEPLDSRLVTRGDPDRLGTRLRPRQALAEPERRHADEAPGGVHVERPEALADEMRRRREPALVGDAPRGEQPDALGAQEPAGRVGGVASIGVLREQADERALDSGLAAGEPERGEEERQEGLGDPCRRAPLRARERTQPLALGELGREGL